MQVLKFFANDGAISTQQDLRILSDISQLPGLEEGLNNCIYFNTSSSVRLNENCVSGHRILSLIIFRKILETKAFESNS